VEVVVPNATVLREQKQNVRTASPSCGSAGFKAETTAERKTSKEWRGRLQKQQNKTKLKKKKQGLGDDDDDLGSFFFLERDHC